MRPALCNTGVRTCRLFRLTDSWGNPPCQVDSNSTHEPQMPTARTGSVLVFVTRPESLTPERTRTPAGIAGMEGFAYALHPPAGQSGTRCAPDRLSVRLDALLLTRHRQFLGPRARVSFALRGASKILRCSIGSWTTCVRALSLSQSSSSLSYAPPIIISISFFPRSFIVVASSSSGITTKTRINIGIMFFSLIATVVRMTIVIIIIIINIIEAVSSSSTSWPHTACIIVPSTATHTHPHDYPSHHPHQARRRPPQRQRTEQQ